MNSSEFRDVASGLYYVATQSKNRELAKDAIAQLQTLRESVKESKRASTDDLVELIDTYVDEGRKKVGFHAYDAAEVFNDPSDVSKTCWAFVAYAVFMIAIASYISVVNKSLRNAN